jgi:iron complex transport system substrate-binding protein
VGAVLLLVLAACGGDGGDGAATSAGPSDSTTTAPSSERGWTYTDDRGVTVTLDAPPQRIVAYVGTAAVLWDFGVRPIGVFGPLLNDDGTPQAAAGRIDVDAVQSAGDGWDGVNLEALAALQPDLVVTGGVDAPWVIGDQMDEVLKIAPVAVIEVYRAPASSILANYERFAVATGIDPDSEALAAARADHEAARDELAGAIAAKPGLTALVTYADAEGLYIANPPSFPDLLELESLGLDVVDPPPGTDYFEQLSWEVADKYPADVILHDIREFSLQPDQLAVDQPTWSQLPAVAAGQIGAWSAEAILSYQGLADVYRELTATVEAARTDVV